VGDTVTVTVKGYGAGQSALVTFDSGAGIRSVVRVRASSTGAATGSFVVPASTRGSHRAIGTDDSGHSTSTRFDTLPSLVAESPIAAGAVSPVTLRGFVAGETVELRWGSSTGSVLTTKVVTASGSGAITVLIPTGTADGKHSLWAVGNLGTAIRVTVTTFTVAEVPTSTPNSTATATAIDSPTGEATATIVEPTPSPTETATNEAPTATPIPPTETPTETGGSESTPAD
jgi:hypothetical protein